MSDRRPIRECVNREQIMDRILYNPETGSFNWRGGQRRGKPSKDGLAGVIDNKGRRRICIDGKRYLASHIAFLIVHGRWPDPTLYLDHINGDRSDDRIENLREVTLRENNQNRVEHRRGKLCGTVFHKGKGGRKRPWQAKITIDGVCRSLGYFPTEQEAHQAYLKIAKGVA